MVLTFAEKPYFCGMKTDNRPLLSFDRQAIGLEQVINARDLGGIPLSDGRRVKKGRLIRCGSLADASDDDVRRLEQEFHIALDFDLRSSTEIKHNPDRAIPGVRYVPLPVLDETGIREEEKKAFKTSGQPPEFFLEICRDRDAQQFAKFMYTSLVTNEYTQLQYSAFFNLMLAQEEGVILWHSSQGKDRTGLAAAFLLSALGADRETVLADYALSAVPYEREFDAICALAARMGYGEEAVIETARTFISVNINYFKAALDVIDTQFGGMQAYLRDILSVSDEDIATLRHRYTD